jgi:hypothetical protein
LEAAYGLAGSFFVRSYNETPPFGGEAISFYKKRFIGNAQNLSIGIHLKNGFSLKTGIHFQHFTQNVRYNGVFSGVTLEIEKDIHHRDFMLYGGIKKEYKKKRNIIAWGSGIYYLMPKQEEIDIAPRYISIVERNQKNNHLNEAGVYGELMYEYSFQPRVNIGLKTQFYYTVTAAYAESITLAPFIRIIF